MRLTALLLAAFVPSAALAMGGDSAPPQPTETTQECEGKMVWDPKVEKCVTPDATGLSDDDRYRAAREIAWAGRPMDALAVLDAMTEGNTDRVMTYRGFALRKAGFWDEGRTAYDVALAMNPDNLLARGYLGLGLLERGDTLAAIDQLLEIRARGGEGSWPETALASAIATGELPDY